LIVEAQPNWLAIGHWSTNWYSALEYCSVYVRAVVVR
jgi:hypothetical protein